MSGSIGIGSRPCSAGWKARGCGRPQITFWLRELRTPALLVEIAGRRTRLCRRLIPTRPLLAAAVARRGDEIERALREEEIVERKRDKRYWLPLKKELERLRHA
jgi:hypothetical protein